MLLYGLKNCDTCRTALKILSAAGIAVEFRDIREAGLTVREISKWAKSAGWRALFNTRSTSYRALSNTEKSDIDEKKAIALMAANPTLIKRPVVINQQIITVGWTKKTKAQLLSEPRR